MQLHTFGLEGGLVILQLKWSLFKPFFFFFFSKKNKTKQNVFTNLQSLD